jgi:glycosyltransferase involved in cell wall biosynthesis
LESALPVSCDIIFDSTHIIVRQGVRTPTGIDRVDHAYATEFSGPNGMAAGVQCALPFVRTLSAGQVGTYAARMSDAWGERTSVGDDPVFNAYRGFITADTAPRHNSATPPPVAKPGLFQRWRKAGGTARRLLQNDSTIRIPDGGLFLNVTQNPVLVPRAARFLASRSDLKAVFLIHDLIPIDYPEYFPPGRKEQFETVLAVIFRHASALITTTEVVRQRIREEMRRNGFAPVPIHVEPLPISPGFDQAVPFEERLAAGRYVVMVGTVEPRKNHWMMLQLWRQMIRQGDDPPRLVIVGARGWENESVHDLLSRTPDLARFVLHLEGLSNEGLRRVIGHARALLMPSYIEGFGIPVIEAATLGTPVIASDHPVFAEVSQGQARLVGALDGPGWRRAILETAGPASASQKGRIQTLGGFVPPVNARYFANVRQFLAEIKT